jgi:hypothetical protein
MKGQTQCAVQNCTASISGYSNLCDSHRIPGAIVRMGDNTMIIAAWKVEHEHESGIVFLNDFASGDLFGGRAGFEAKLRKQGFVNVNLLRTPEELAASKAPAEAKKVGDWGGPWRTKYPWEVVKAKSEESRATGSEVRDPEDPSAEKTHPIADCDAWANGKRCGKPAIWSGPCPACDCNPKIHLCSDHYSKWQRPIDDLVKTRMGRGRES